MKTFNILARSDLAILLFSTICEEYDHTSPEFKALSKSVDPDKSGECEVKLTLNGVDIPIEGLAKAINRQFESYNKDVSEQALIMIQRAGLDAIRDNIDKISRTLEDANLSLKKTLREKAGAEFYE